MSFSQKREIVEIRNQSDFEELDEFEDLELHIKGAVSVKENLEITDCNILFDSGSKMELKGGKAEFNDCEIAFPGDTGKVMIADGGDIAFDSCNIFQLESSAKETDALISSDKNEKTIEVSNCKIHDINGMFIQSNGTNIYVDKTEVYNLSGCLVNIQKGTKGFSPAFELMGCSFNNCEKMERHKDNCLVKIGHIMSGKIEDCKFRDCQIDCISADGNRWDGDDDGKDSKDCPFIVNKCTFENCANKPVRISLYNTKITDSEFYKCKGLEAKTQLSELYIENCKFKECKSEEPRDGVLSILVDVYEKCIYIKNCKFEKCAVDRETRYNEGIIFLTSGIADRSQRETVTIEKCSFQGCIGSEIRGVERDEGFFGKSVKLYIRKY